MWEKVNKILIVNVIALVIILTCATITVVSVFHPIPQESTPLVSKFYDVGMLAVLGWAFTVAKNKQA